MACKNNVLKRSAFYSLFFIFVLLPFLRGASVPEPPGCNNGVAGYYTDSNTGMKVWRSAYTACCVGNEVGCCAVGYADPDRNEMFLYDPPPPAPCYQEDFDPDIDIEPPAASCNPGLIQYRVDGSCGTVTRICCGTVRGFNTHWSNWGEDCHGCEAEQCWNGTECEEKIGLEMECRYNILNSFSGILTRSASCGTNGWQYGSWQGVCTCQQGYSWNSNLKTCDPGSMSDFGGGMFNPEQPIKPIGS